MYDFESVANYSAEFSSFDRISVGRSGDVVAVHMYEGTLNIILIYVEDGGVYELAKSQVFTDPAPTPVKIMEAIKGLRKSLRFLDVPLVASDVKAAVEGLRVYRGRGIPGAAYSFRFDYVHPRSMFLGRLSWGADYELAVLRAEDVFVYPVLLGGFEGYPLRDSRVVKYLEEVLRGETRLPGDVFPGMFESMVARFPSPDEFMVKVGCASVVVDGGVEYYINHEDNKILCGGDTFIDAIIDNPHITLTPDHKIKTSCTIRSNHIPPIYLHDREIKEIAETLKSALLTTRDIDEVTHFLEVYTKHLIENNLCEVDFYKPYPVPYLIPPRMHFNPDPTKTHTRTALQDALTTLTKLFKILPSGGQGRLMNVLAWGLYHGALGRVNHELGRETKLLALDGIGFIEKRITLQALIYFLNTGGEARVTDEGQSLFPLYVLDAGFLSTDPGFRARIERLLETGESLIPGVPDYSAPITLTRVPSYLMGIPGLRDKMYTLNFVSDHSLRGGDDELRHLRIQPTGLVERDSPLTLLGVLGYAMVDDIVSRYNRGEEVLNFGMHDLFRDTLHRLCRACDFDAGQFKGRLVDAMVGGDSVAPWLSTFGHFVRRVYRKMRLRRNVKDISGSFFRAVARGVFQGFELDDDMEHVLIFEDGLEGMTNLPLEGLAMILGRPVKIRAGRPYVEVSREDFDTVFMPHIFHKV